MAEEQTREKFADIRYVNHRNKKGWYRILPLKLWWGTSAFHDEEQWMLSALAVKIKTRFCDTCGGSGESPNCCPGAVETCETCQGEGTQLRTYDELNPAENGSQTTFAMQDVDYWRATPVPVSRETQTRTR